MGGSTKGYFLSCSAHGFPVPVFLDTSLFGLDMFPSQPFSLSTCFWDDKFSKNVPEAEILLAPIIGLTIWLGQGLKSLWEMRQIRSDTHRRHVPASQCQFSSKKKSSFPSIINS